MIPRANTLTRFALLALLALAGCGSRSDLDLGASAPLLPLPSQGPGASGQGGSAGAAGSGGSPGSAGASGQAGGSQGGSSVAGASGAAGASPKPQASSCEGKGLQPGSPWPMLHRCPNHQARADAVTPAARKVRWEVEHPGIFGSPVVAADGTVYVSAGHLLAVDSTGKQLWADPSTTSPWWPGATPAIGADGTVYVGGAWSESGPGTTPGPAMAFFALRPDGQVRWAVSVPSGLAGWSSAAIGPDGVVYVGGPPEHLYAFSPDGQLLWKQPAGHMHYGIAPSIGHDGAVYTVNYEGKLHAFGPGGEPRWALEDDEYWTQPVIGDDGSLFVQAKNALHSLDAKGGLRWKYEADALHFLVSQRPDGALLVGRLFTLEALGPDGSLLWSRSIPNFMLHNAAFGPDGRGVVNFGSLAAIDQAGATEWVDPLPSKGMDSWQGVAIGADGVVYAASDDRLVAFEP